MPALTPSTTFEHIAREWRCKWSEDNDKASLEAATQLLASVAPDLKKHDGVVSVQRVVCGGCQDFKVIIKVTADKYDGFKEGGHGGEEAFMTKLMAIPGLHTFDTQTYTFEEL